MYRGETGDILGTFFTSLHGVMSSSRDLGAMADVTVLEMECMYKTVSLISFLPHRELRLTSDHARIYSTSTLILLTF